MSVATTEKPSATTDITYEDLYNRWERGNWKAHEIDFSADRKGWEALNEIQTKSALWIYSMFFFGEDSVADNLSPYIDAAPKEEQKYFLATQQVDEARHAVFFHRFFREVIGAGDSISSTLAYTLPQLGWGYRGVFDRLDRMADELRHDRSLPKFAQAIALYHMVVEATLAQPGQHFIEDFFIKEGTMPGFSAGMVNVSQDEQRHIGFGVKALSEMFAETDECKDAVVELLLEVMPYSLAVFIPPGWDDRYTTEYGFTLEQIYGFGMRSIEAKWRAAGYPLEEMPPQVYPVDRSLPHEERAKNQIVLLKAGILGEPNGRPASDPEAMRVYFETVKRSSDPSAINGSGLKVQWRFSDADPWHLVVDNGSTEAAPGELADPDLTIETDWREWIEVSLRGKNPARSVLGRKLRPKGSPRALHRFRKVFEPRPTRIV